MRKSVFKRSPLSSLLSSLTSILFTLVIIGIIIAGLGMAEQSGSAEGLLLLENGIRRAAVTCYITEGRYPDSVDYIEQHYGVRVDKTRYVVHYEVFASNIMPEITVIDLSGNGKGA